MRERHKEGVMPPRPTGAHPWRAPVLQTEVPEAGLHLDLVADESVRAGLAELAGLTALPRLDCQLRRDTAWTQRPACRRPRVGNRRSDLRSDARPDRERDRRSHRPLLRAHRRRAGAVKARRRKYEVSLDDSPEPLIGGTVDLGALATEFLVLGIDPYPRKSGTVFQAPGVGDDSAQPFAALAALKEKGRGG